MFHVRYVRCNYKDALNKTDVDKQELVDENIHCLTQVNSFVHKGISGIIAVILIILGMLIAAKWRLAQFDMKAPIIKDVVFIIELISMLALTILVILPIVHEFLHAIVYPGHAEKIIYISSHGVCYTYCEAKMSKGRMILMLILPLLTLCILPFAVNGRHSPFVLTVDRLGGLCCCAHKPSLVTPHHALSFSKEYSLSWKACVVRNREAAGGMGASRGNRRNFRRGLDSARPAADN